MDTEVTMKELNATLKCISDGICKCGNSIEKDSLYKMSGHCQKCSLEIEKELNNINVEEVIKKYKMRWRLYEY